VSIWNDEHTVEMYSIGICAASVCAPKDMDHTEVVRICNETSPTGISSDWQLSKDKTFKNGEPHPCTCESDKARQHWLLEC
jgi:hypothetical protein